MSISIKDLFNSASQLSSVSTAKTYISTNARRASVKVVSVAKPYADLAQENVRSAKVFVNTKVDEIRQADSLGAIVDIVVGIIITVMRVVIGLLASIRSLILKDSSSRPARFYLSLESYTRGIVHKMVGFPNLPVVKKVEGVSKKVLGDSRHDQALDFIKTNVIDRVYEKLGPAAQQSPSGSSTADLTTEGGSVTGSSPRDATRKSKSHQRRK
jgi:hypothetical protein